MLKLETLSIYVAHGLNHAYSLAILPPPPDKFIISQAIMLLPYITFFFPILTTSKSSDTIAVHQSISDGETIVSQNAKFELGFFSLGNSNSRYLGIWFKNTSPQTVAWVANRETPHTDTSNTVKLDEQGYLTLVNSSDKVIWSSNSSASGTNINLVAQLLDTGNLVVKNGNKANNEIFIWQSFDYPGDTYLNGMKLGKNFITGRETYLRSWRGSDNPSPGEYTSRVFAVKGKYPQVYIRRNSAKKTRIGPFNGIPFSGWANHAPDAYGEEHLSYLIMNQNETYISCFTNRNSTTLRAIITPDGKLEFSKLNILNPEWIPIATLSVDYCDNYGVCGPYGSCTTSTSPNCGCLKGFERKKSDNGTSVCQRRVALDCGPREGFLKFSSMKLPDTETAVFSSNMSLQDCEVACKNNCSCIAYANTNITSGGVGCFLWYGGLIDVRVYPRNEQDMYVRLAASELSETSSYGSLSIASVYSLSVLVLAFYTRRKWKKRSDAASSGQMGSAEVPLFSLSKISKATNDFSDENKLGEGGGYISPEYAVNVLYLVKSDIFSFGVLVLEIVSGKKNIGFVHEGHADNLIGHFELGFFSPGSSKSRYLGIWFKCMKPKTIAWVANRETPLIDTSGVVKLDSKGNLILVNGSGKVIWSSNSSASGTNINLVAQLLDTGNLVVKNGNKANNETFIWQSFDYPGDTYLNGMKLGKNFITRRETYLRSWRSTENPFPGEYTSRVSAAKGKYPQVYIRRSSDIKTRIGPYNGISFSGWANYAPDANLTDNLSCMIMNQNETYITCFTNRNTNTLRAMVTPEGKLEFSEINYPNPEWISIATVSVDYCENYGVCGPYGSCTTDTSPNCGCLKGFELKNVDNDTIVCQRRIALDCGPGEGFLKFSSLKLPDTENAIFSSNTSLLDCELVCKNNCSCTAYANPIITSGGVGCLLWYGGLIDVRVYPQNGQDLYVRLAASELSDLHSSFHRKKRVVMEVTLSIASVLSLSGLVSAFCTRRKWMKRSDAESSNQMGNAEVPLLSLSKISRATNDFSVDNKLGEGGFGPVYKKKAKRLLGYISPEYAMNGLYSIKSDIFSFGVLVLEIVSGKKNRGFVHEDHDDNLLGH
ncbi:hypothetical protein L1987_62236 [Smallanthus sonchifolius]|uniref:Uncharacterized protein n=1 Tax=Smallanthus sonchifolius TaxID=185202 RepID=A0ACB9C9Z4_9ASTR|nr:hypothetical protein L1987_62236 [Smallanthus sonchifolius]